MDIYFLANVCKNKFSAIHFLLVYLEIGLTNCLPYQQSTESKPRNPSSCFCESMCIHVIVLEFQLGGLCGCSIVQSATEQVEKNLHFVFIHSSAFF